MSAIVATTNNFDDEAQMVRDLLDQLEHLPEGPALGFLHCDSQVNAQALLDLLAPELNFPLVGGTAMAFPFFDMDQKNISACLLVFNKKNMASAVAVSEILDPQNHVQQIKDVYSRCLDSLNAEPNLIIPFFPLIPGLSSGHFIDDIFTLAGSIPVFGGVTTGDLISTEAFVFADGRAFNDRMVLLMLGGSVKPVFAAANQITRMTAISAAVTKSVENHVYQVEDNTFCDYLKALGISPENRINGVDALMQYGPIPVEVHIKHRPPDDVPEVRCISYTNITEGSAVFSGNLPEGSRLTVGILTKEDVLTSTRRCLDQLTERMQGQVQSGYEFSAMFCISCVARYFVMVGDLNQESSYLMNHQPEGLASAGYYAFCEIGPTLASDDKRVLNRSHSASICMCAL